MGRCQRNWCGPKLMEILGRELGNSQQGITFKGQGYNMLAS